MVLGIRYSSFAVDFLNQNEVQWLSLKIIYVLVFGK